MLADAQVVSFLSTARPDAAARFYTETLGFRLERREPLALVLSAGPQRLRINIVERMPGRVGTALGWNVTDIDATVAALAGRGVTFETYAGMPQDERGIATFENGDRVAWFQDPDGNVLSVTQLAIARAGAPVVNFEIGCPDAEVSKTFFERVFGWTATEYGPTAFWFDTGSARGIRGFTNALGHEPRNYVNIYIETPDIAATVAKIEANGGRVVIPENPAPGGRFCWFNDPAGNLLALWSPDTESAGDGGGS